MPRPSRHKAKDSKRASEAIRELAALATCCRRVPLYFFDTRDNDTFIEDDVGLEFPDLDTVKAQAAMSLAELARDVLPGSVRRVLAVEVRDERQPILIATMTFEAIVLLE